MDTKRIAGPLAVGLLAAVSAAGHTGHLHGDPGSLVGVAVEVGGRPAPLYPAADGSGRFYLEAQEGASYVVRLSNRSGQRLGVVLTVDGLNAISGARDQARGRMYVLDPRQQTSVRGWRTSLQEVRRFTFVDEKVSYAARSGKANSHMGWIEVSVYRERRHRLWDWEPDRAGPGVDGEGEDFDGQAGAPSAPAPSSEAAEAAASPTRRARPGARKRSYPGTGWGARAHDPVILVDFKPERTPAERTTLRYEYRRALVDLGVLPSPHARHDRLRERDRGDHGFAPPPRW